MEAVQLQVALRILEHAGIPTCLVGELALNYYNVPRVLHDIEICVPESMVLEAASFLYGTGLFKPDEIKEFDLYNEYKRGHPRLQYKIYSLDPIPKNVLSLDKFLPSASYSNQIMDLIPPAEIHKLPIPRLPALLAGFCLRFLESHDDVAMIAAEQLVDGMDLDDDWCDRNLRIVGSEVLEIAKRLIAGKSSRLHDFSDNTITCFIADRREADRVRRIPGHE